MKFSKALVIGVASVIAPASAALLPNLCPTPSTVKGFNDIRLPDPFKFDDGTPVRTKADWDCRRSQIAALIQGYEAGELPPAPRHLSATFEKNGTEGNLTITTGNDGPAISWSNIITYPTGDPPRGGWPLVIGYDGGSIPVPSNVSTHYDHS